MESEAEFLAKYGFLTEKCGKYLCNILLYEPSNELIELKDKMYSRAAELFANELLGELTNSGILKDSRIICDQTDDPVTFKHVERADENFILWSLIPYITALSGEGLMDKSISFDEVATIRPDGGYNLCSASVAAPNVKLPMYFESMLHFYGPCWNGNEDYILWQIDSEWSTERVKDGWFQSVAQVVWLENTEINKELIAIGDRIKEKHWVELKAMKESFIKKSLDETPKHLQKMQKFEFQYIFFSDGWFILHCLKELVNNGKLMLPTEEQKKSLTTIIVPNK